MGISQLAMLDYRRVHNPILPHLDVLGLFLLRDYIKIVGTLSSSSYGGHEHAHDLSGPDGSGVVVNRATEALVITMFALRINREKHP